jgi:hypothetical protein
MSCWTLKCFGEGSVSVIYGQVCGKECGQSGYENKEELGLVTRPEFFV